MYVKHFGLTRRPFAVTADAPVSYPATGQERAFEQLTAAVAEQEGYAVLTGPTGTGKTLLAQRLLAQVDGDFATLWITHTHLADVTALLQALLYDLGQAYQGLTEQEMRLQLLDHLLKTFQSGRRTLIILDEAQHLTTPQLEELRLLGNLATRRARIVQILLVGQPALVDTLRRPVLAALCQRIGVWARLGPLDVHEAVDYLVHHLRAAGGRPERIVTAEALELLAQAAGGVPRVLNLAAHQALHLAWAAGEPQVDAEAAIEALRELGLPPALEAPIMTFPGEDEDGIPARKSA
jgi:type II secretory pathway predicted ATPase ExeA